MLLIDPINAIVQTNPSDTIVHPDLACTIEESHKESIQYPELLQISKKTVGRPIEVHIEWAQKHYKRGTYATINRVQRLEEKDIYMYAL